MYNEFSGAKLNFQAERRIGIDDRWIDTDFDADQHSV